AGWRVAALVVWHTTFLVLRLSNGIGVHSLHRFFADGPADTTLDQLQEAGVAEGTLVMAEGRIEHPALAVFLHPGVGLPTGAVYPLHQHDDIVGNLVVHIRFVPFGLKRGNAFHR